MSRRARWVGVLSCAFLLALALVALWLVRDAAPPRAAIAWRVQPDSFPLGTVVQGSRVEMSLGLFSGIKPKPPPAFLASLPSPLRKASEWTVERFHQVAARLGLGVRTEAPAFLEVERTEVAAHSSQGPFAMVSFRLKTDSPGDWRGNLVVRLKGGSYGVTNLTIPVSANVIARTTDASNAVLITESPYEGYATGDGKDFAPSTMLNRRLALQGVRVDYCRNLPASLRPYRTILLAGSEMAGLSPAKMEQLRKYVAGGGRLILAANAFFVPTVPKANKLLGAYGLQIIDRDAGQAITNSPVASDRLTAGVKRVDFWRPSQINVTDPSQGKLLVESEDGTGGFVAVSRQESRGEVIVLTQSLWWTWIRSDPAKADVMLLLENLLVK